MANSLFTQMFSLFIVNNKLFSEDNLQEVLHGMSPKETPGPGETTRDVITYY